jgi:hypothetical protein
VADKKVLPSPPWKTGAKVTYACDMFYTIKFGSSEAHVDWDGDWWVSHDSRKEIVDHMALDRDMTKKIQKDFEAGYGYGSDGWAKWIREWIEGTAVLSGKVGPKDWYPKGKKQAFGSVFGRNQGGMGSGNTTNEDSAYFWGDTFEYTHFLTTDGDEGVVIMWHGGGDVRGNYNLPEIWMGDFGGFMSLQEEGDPKGPEAFLSWNEGFQNTLLWAFDELGLFEGKTVLMPVFGGGREPVSHLPTEQIVDAIELAPQILYPSLVEKILMHRDILPEDLVLVAGKVMDKTRREVDEAGGQGYFWKPPPL